MDLSDISEDEEKVYVVYSYTDARKENWSDVHSVHRCKAGARSALEKVKESLKYVQCWYDAIDVDASMITPCEEGIWFVDDDEVPGLYLGIVETSLFD